MLDDEKTRTVVYLGGSVPDWDRILRLARSGSMLQPPIGEVGSAGWRSGDPVPKSLILCDLGLLQLPNFSPDFADVEELDLSCNALVGIPEVGLEYLKELRSFFLGGIEEGDPPRRNSMVNGLPSLGSLTNLENLSLHDTDLRRLPKLPASLRELRVDRCPLDELPEELPALTTLHLEGCPLPGTLERPELLPNAVKRLRNSLDDLQLPDGCHIGLFFGSEIPTPTELGPQSC